MTIVRGPRLDAAMSLVQRFDQVPPAAAGKANRPDPQRSPVGWPTTRHALAQQLRQRLSGHDLPRQVGTSYCGPAAFLYCLLEDRPDIYVDYAVSMWLHGEYDFRSPRRALEITSNPGVRASLTKAQHDNPKQAFISDLDWMTMAPLSMSTRPGPISMLLGTPTPSDQLGSVSYPSVVKDWFAAAGASLRFDTMGVGLLKSPPGSTIKLLSNWTNNWIVMQIDSSLLRGGGRSTNTFANRHWVVVNPHRQPLVRVGDTGQVVQMADVLKSVPASDPHPDMGKWQTSLYFVSWGDENTPLQDQHLGHLAGRIYGGFAFSHFA